MFDQITVDATGISPPFEHHCHPYFAIHNAVPKFCQHRATLTPAQQQLFEDLLLVVEFWNDYFAKVAGEGLLEKD